MKSVLKEFNIYTWDEAREALKVYRDSDCEENETVFEEQ